MVLLVLLVAERPPPFALDRLAREYELKDKLDGAWAAHPLELVREDARALLVLEDPGGEPLARLLGAPMEAGGFLRLAIGIAAALGKAHQRGLVHKDLKPAHILVNCADGQVRLTGFGNASQLPRERQPLEPLETIAGTLAYMAPEQTGRMNRSINSRSDLYSLGVTFYQMLTGSLPFNASEPMEWVHCHIARRPAPPSERIKNVPAPVSQMIMKLLAKTAEERYQTAAGVERDLRRCLADWERRRRIDGFQLGEHDTPDRLLIPEKLYGREREVETLLVGFDRVVKSGAPELVLVAGYSGIGKSSVVNELHKALVPSGGLFASGKFDRYKRDIPYSALAQAFQNLIRGLLGKSDVELALWRDALLEALGPNGRLVIDLVPELKLIIGDPQPVPELEPQQAQSRFQHVFRRFIGVFARPEHPLALFLDDLQWLDAATLELLENLLTRSDLQHLMLIGAYRDDEVDANHPLMRKLQIIRNAGAKVQEITLAPLGREHVENLIADVLHCESERAAPLAQLVYEKTAGNPFFVIQFLHALAEEDLLRFDHDAARRSWDPHRIHDKGYADNVVNLISRAAASHTVSGDQRQQHISALAAHHRQLQVWAKNCPENFENRAALVAAEIARLESRELDAERLYEQAIRSARDNGFVDNEAIAYERASDFYRARGFDQIADLYLENARYAYVRWGADGKVRQLEAMDLHLRREEPALGPSTAIATPVERLDLATVIKLSQSVSSEMVLERLIDRVTRTAIAQAGAERGLLILSRDAEPRIEAEATTSGDVVVVELRDAPVTSSVLPETVLRHVLRTRESVVLDAAATEPSFAADLATHRRRPSATATGDPQLGHQCHRSDERIGRSAPGIAAQQPKETSRMTYWSQCGIRGRDWRRRPRSASSTPFLQPSRAAWGWGCRSAAR